LAKKVTAVEKKLSVLIVDDALENVRLMGLIFHRGGYDIQKAHTGQEALKKIETQRPHLVILDVMMPDMSGLEVCRQVRANPAIAHTPIIMVSAKGMVDDRVSGLQAGADDYMVKPVDGSELLARAKALLSRVTAAVKPSARIIAFVGAKGGMGVSTVALNAATSLASLNQSVVVFELSDYVSWMRLSLDMPVSHTLGDLLEMEADQIERLDVSRRLVRHPSGIRFLLAPEQRPAKPINNNHVGVIMHALGPEADYVVVDIQNMTTPGSLPALQAADRILIVVEPELMAVAHARTLLESLKKSGLGNRTNIVLNGRVSDDTALTRMEVETQLDLTGAQDSSRWTATGGLSEKRGGPRIVASIPPAAEPLHVALRQREPLVLAMPNLVVSKAYRDLAQWITESE
jgi:DNA-binding response OmpR family regulator